MRPSHHVLKVAISELLHTNASLVAIFRRPGAPQAWTRAFHVTSQPAHFLVLSPHGPPAYATTPAAAIALMSDRGRLALESIVMRQPGKPAFHWFGPGAGFVDSSEERHAAATAIQRAFLGAAAARCRRVRDFHAAYVSAASETLGAGRPARKFLRM